MLECPHLGRGNVPHYKCHCWCLSRETLKGPQCALVTSSRPYCSCSGFGVTEEFACKISLAEFNYDIKIERPDQNMRICALKSMVSHMVHNSKLGLADWPLNKVIKTWIRTETHNKSHMCTHQLREVNTCTLKLHDSSRMHTTSTRPDSKWGGEMN